MTYKGTEYHSDVEGKDIKIMQEKNEPGTIKLREREKFSDVKQNNQLNKRR